MAAKPKTPRIGFAAGKFTAPDDFGRMFDTEIEALFSGEAEDRDDYPRTFRTTSVVPSIRKLR